MGESDAHSGVTLSLKDQIHSWVLLNLVALFGSQNGLCGLKSTELYPMLTHYWWMAPCSSRGLHQQNTESEASPHHCALEECVRENGTCKDYGEYVKITRVPTGSNSLPSWTDPLPLKQSETVWFGSFLGSNYKTTNYFCFRKLFYFIKLWVQRKINLLPLLSPQAILNSVYIYTKTLS